MVLAEYEQKRKAGDPDFNELETTQIVVGGQVKASFTTRQGQFLAFIHYYTKLNRQPPAEADMQRHFQVTPPVVHDMILTLEKKGLIARTPGAARTIRVLLPPEQVPDLA
jgi:repressor LexA